MYERPALSWAGVATTAAGAITDDERLVLDLLAGAREYRYGWCIGRKVKSIAIRVPVDRARASPPRAICTLSGPTSQASKPRCRSTETPSECWKIAEPSGFPPYTQFRVDNMLFDAKGGAVPVAILDWQTVGMGVGTIDLAYFLGAA